MERAGRGPGCAPAAAPAACAAPQAGRIRNHAWLVTPPPSHRPRAPPSHQPAVVREICPKGMGGAERMPVYLPENWPEQLMALQPGLQLTAPAATAAPGGAAPAAAVPSASSSSDASGGEAAAGIGGTAAARFARATTAPAALPDGRSPRAAPFQPAAAAAAMLPGVPPASAPLAAAAAAALASSAAGSMGFVNSPRAPVSSQQRHFLAHAATAPAPLPALPIAGLTLPSLPAPVPAPVLTVRPICTGTAAAAHSPLASSTPLSPFALLRVSGTPTAAAALTPHAALARTIAAATFGAHKPAPLAAAAALAAAAPVSPKAEPAHPAATHGASSASEDAGASSPERPAAPHGCFPAAL